MVLRTQNFAFNGQVLEQVSSPEILGAKLSLTEKSDLGKFSHYTVFMTRKLIFINFRIRNQGLFGQLIPKFAFGKT
jgi:hypothetical protein